MDSRFATRSSPVRLCCSIFSAALLLPACGAVERASVIVIPTSTSADAFSLISAHKPGVQATFDGFVKGNGYRCHSTFKNKEKRVCRGPKDLHMTFQPRAAGTGYVAGFSWVLSEERSAAEFRREVDAFADALRSADALTEVRLGQFEE
jgi:hypothetical protein